MLLNDIKEKLREVDPCVYYGMVDKNRRETEWNYIVFDRVKMRSSQNKTGKIDLFDVHIIRENFIPDGLAEEVIQKITSIAGVRETTDDGEYEYAEKQSTGNVVEMLTLHFARARKNV